MLAWREEMTERRRRSKVMRRFAITALLCACSSTSMGPYEEGGSAATAGFVAHVSSDAADNGDARTDAHSGGAAGSGSAGYAGSGGAGEFSGSGGTAGAAPSPDAATTDAPGFGGFAGVAGSATDASPDAAPPTCDLSEAAARLQVREVGPMTVSIDAFRYEEQNECIECVAEPCASCDVLWLQTLTSDGVTLQAEATCDVAAIAPHCDSSLCGVRPTCGLYAGLEAVPEKDGWRVVSVDADGSDCALPLLCGTTLPFGYQDALTAAVLPSWESQIIDLYLPCPES